MVFTVIWPFAFKRGPGSRADLYFAAVQAAERGQDPSRACAPLFDARSRTGVAPIQFALAGMNAHINYDLALALNITCDELSLRLRRGSRQHRDYLAVNEILERVQERVKKRLAVGLAGVADDALGRIDDVLAAWSVARAREAAWTHAETLRALRGWRRVHDEFKLTLARSVGLAGRALLVPTTPSVASMTCWRHGASRGHARLPGRTPRLCVRCAAGAACTTSSS